MWIIAAEVSVPRNDLPWSLNHRPVSGRSRCPSRSSLAVWFSLCVAFSHLIICSLHRVGADGFERLKDNTSFSYENHLQFYPSVLCAFLCVYDTALNFPLLQLHYGGGGCGGTIFLRVLPSPNRSTEKQTYSLSGFFFQKYSAISPPCCFHKPF